MKATKLLCGIAAMALAFAACNKVEQPANESENLKSIAVKFDNINFMTKAEAGNAIKSGDNIAVQSVQVLFTDGNKLYLGQNASGAAAEHYFTTTTGASKTFHFLPANVIKVIAIANYKKIEVIDGETLLADVVNNIKFNVGDRQDQTNLPLYGESGLTKISAPSSTDKDHPHATNVDYYKSEVTLLPRVARIEIRGFEYAAEEEAGAEGLVAKPRMYSKIQLNQVAVSNYYNGYTLYNGTPSTELTNDGTSASEVVAYLKANAEATDPAWYFDLMEATLESDSYKYVADATNDNKALFAYTLPADALVPYIYLNMNGFIGSESLETSTPLNLVALKLMDGESQVTELIDGNIYRVDFKFDDSDLKLQGKCIDVTVKVSTWNVIEVTPEFK